VEVPQRSYNSKRLKFLTESLVYIAGVLIIIFLERIT